MKDEQLKNNTLSYSFFEIDQLVHKSIMADVYSESANFTVVQIFFSSIESLVGKGLYSKLYSIFEAYMDLTNTNVNYLNLAKEHDIRMNEYSSLLNEYYEFEMKLNSTNANLVSGEFNPEIDNLIIYRSEIFNNMNIKAKEINDVAKYVNVLSEEKKDISDIVQKKELQIKTIYSSLIKNQEKDNVLKFKLDNFKSESFYHFQNSYNNTVLNVRENNIEEIFDILYNLAIKEIDCLVQASNHARALVKKDPLREFNSNELNTIAKDYDNWNNLVVKFQEFMKK